MKNRSKIAAIILSLSLAGSIRAGIETWLLSAITITNVGPYVGAAINAATNMGNLYLSYRNGQKIDAVQADVQKVSDKVDQVDQNVSKLNKKVDKTNTLMGGLYQETKIGLQAVNEKLAHNTQQLGIVHRNLENLRVEQQANMETLTQQNAEINNKLDLMKDGISGVNDRVANLENSTKAGFDTLKQQNSETQTQLNDLNQKLDGFSTFATTGMEKMATIETLLQKLVGSTSKTTEKQEDK